jgi:hypothetical protein
MAIHISAKKAAFLDPDGGGARDAPLQWHQSASQAGTPRSSTSPPRIFGLEKQFIFQRVLLARSPVVGFYKKFDRAPNAKEAMTAYPM